MLVICVALVEDWSFLMSDYRWARTCLPILIQPFK